MTRPLLSLVMIVKDEVQNLRGVLESVRPFIDRWTILDTGSTDGTQDLIKEAMRGIKGDLFEEPFIDFATSRNRVMNLDSLDSSSEFQLMISGDEYLRNGEELVDYLETQRSTKIDCHFLRIKLDDIALFYPRVLRTGSNWKYEGVIHETPCNRTEENAEISCAPRSVVIEHIVSDPERRYANIWENHIPLLQAQLEDNPKDTHALMYLASSYMTLLQFFAPEEKITYAMTAMSLYMRRLAVDNGTSIERNYAKLQILEGARHAGVYTEQELFERADALCKDDEARPEPSLIRAVSASSFMPAHKVYDFALDAINRASKVVDIDNSSPITMSCGWRAHFVAARAALQIYKKYPNGKIGSLSAFDLIKHHISAIRINDGPAFISDGMDKEISDGVSNKSDTETSTIKGLRVDLGTASDAPPDFDFYVDRVRVTGVPVEKMKVADLSGIFPFADGTVNFFRAHDIVEHLPDKLNTMNELWRCLEPGGKVEIVVPTTDGPGAFQDPTHCSFWHERSFFYYQSGNPYRERFAKSYGINAAFEIISQAKAITDDGPKLKIELQAVK